MVLGCPGKPVRPQAGHRAAKRRQLSFSLLTALGLLSVAQYILQPLFLQDRGTRKAVHAQAVVAIPLSRSTAHGHLLSDLEPGRTSSTRVLNCNVNIQVLRLYKVFMGFLVSSFNLRGMKEILAIKQKTVKTNQSDIKLQVSGFPV